jgi:group I intron endonuclease
MYGYIYKTTNLLNNKIYIGQKRGCFDSDYLGSGKILRLAIAKEGKENFEIKILVFAENVESLNELEKKYIKEYRNLLGRNNLYNIADGGDGGPTRLGYSNSEEMKRKQSLSHIGKWSGKKHTIEAKIKSGLPSKDTFWMYHPISKKIKRIKKTSVESYIKEGWKIGRGLSKEQKELNRLVRYGRKWMYNSLNESKLVKQETVSFYLNNNWWLGRKRKEKHEPKL